MSVLCRVCHVFPPLVSIFGLFPVLVSCHYKLRMFQLCLSRYVLITLCILVLSLSLISSGLLVTSPVYPVHVSHALSCLDVSIKYYYLSLSPRLRVLVPPLCVHRDSNKVSHKNDCPRIFFVQNYCLRWCKLLVNLALKG